MRVVTLSDHAADQIQKAQDMRTAVNDRMRADWQAAIDRREADIADHAGALRQAWAKRRVIAVIVIFFNWLGARLSRQPAMPPLLEAGADEGRFQGGQEGEARAVASLSRLFDDQWVAFRGYFNRGGETDLLLVGPTAVVALEVKFLNGVVHCDGTSWSRDKSDKYGNVVERGIPVRDAKGRTPGQQVNATADGLQAQLARRGHSVPVRRVVILAHHASRIGRVSEPGVEFIGVLADRAFQSQFLTLVQPPPGRPDLDVAALEQVVLQDHGYHARAKAQRGNTAPIAAATSASTSPSHPAAPVPSPAGAPLTQALVGPRPIKLIPPSADGYIPLSDLELRQARALGEDIVALHASKGRDVDLENRVRKTISGHLQTGGRLRVLSSVVPIHGHDGELTLLRRLIQECRQTVELEDRTLHAIVVPLAVRWTVPEGADWSAVRIRSVEPSDLDTSAWDLRRALDVEKVVFSKQMYEGGRLVSLDARLLRQALIQLDTGVEPEIAELKPAAVAPSPNAGWQIVYLLAVASTRPGEPLVLNDEARRSLAGRHEMIASAFIGAAMEATGTPDAAEAHAEGVWTLADGVQHGYRLQRRHVLEMMLAPGPSRGHTPEAPMRCWYAADMADLRIRLLVDWGSVRAEREFSMHGEEQPIPAFRKTLDDAIAARVPVGTSIQVEQLDLHDYRAQAQAVGMSWIGQASKRQARNDRPANRAARPLPSADPTAGGARR